MRLLGRASVLPFFLLFFGVDQEVNIMQMKANIMNSKKQITLLKCYLLACDF